MTRSRSGRYLASHIYILIEGPEHREGNRVCENKIHGMPSQAGRMAVDNVQVDDLRNSPSNLRIGMWDGAKGYLIIRVAYFDEDFNIRTCIRQCKRICGTDHKALLKEIEAVDTQGGVWAVALADGCSANGIRGQDRGTNINNVAHHLGEKNPGMLKIWCKSHSVALAVKAPGKIGCDALKALMKEFDSFLCSVAASLAMSPDSKDELKFFAKLIGDFKEIPELQGDYL